VDPEIHLGAWFNTTDRFRKVVGFARTDKTDKTFLDRGDSVEETASKLNLDVQLAWSIALEELDDQQRLEILDEKIKGLSCKPRPTMSGTLRIATIYRVDLEQGDF